MVPKLIWVIAITLGLCAFAAESASATPTFLNPGFEAVAGLFAFGTPMTSSNTPGWMFGSSGAFPLLNTNIACGGSNGAGNEGCNFAILGGAETSGAGFIGQTLTGFVVGQAYTLSWLQSSEFIFMDKVTASISGVTTLSMDFSSDPRSGASWGKWQTMSWPFIADSPTLTFTFHGNGSGLPNCNAGTDSCDPGVDYFQILGAETAPEPSSLLLFGTGLVGLLTLGRNARVQRMLRAADF